MEIGVINEIRNKPAEINSKNIGLRLGLNNSSIKSLQEHQVPA